MNEQNEYAGYSVDELRTKLNRFKRIQMAMLILALLASIAIAITSFVKNASQGYTMIPIFLVVGIGYPFLAFGGIRKRLQEELNSRNCQ